MIVNFTLFNFNSTKLEIEHFIQLNSSWFGCESLMCEVVIIYFIVLSKLRGYLNIFVNDNDDSTSMNALRRCSSSDHSERIQRSFCESEWDLEKFLSSSPLSSPPSACRLMKSTGIFLERDNRGSKGRKEKNGKKRKRKKTSKRAILSFTIIHPFVWVCFLLSISPKTRRI